jgi:hypothetical protein
MGEMRIAYKILVGKSVRERKLGRFRHRWQSNITIDHKGTEREGRNWMHFDKDTD